MIIKKIEITNIRSYKEKTTIELPMGRILFQGDIGSGKSTILSAIEFALFGLGDIDANHLLRIGESKGSVLLEFESGGKIYNVFRSLLRRGNKIFQEEGFLYDNGVKNSYSVGELKSKILNIIGLNERSETKTTSTIYRFAIYTPQEMMKNVLTSNNERRVEILRRAFGLEEYSIAKKNAEKFSSWIRTITKIKRSMLNDLGNYKKELQNIQNITESLKDEIDYVKDSTVNLNDKIQIILKKMLEARQKKERIMLAESSILHLQSTLDKNLKLKEDTNLDLNKINNELHEIHRSEKIVADLGPKYQDYIQKRDALVNVTEKALQYDKLLLDKVKLESSISSEREMFRSNIKTLDSELEELALDLQRIEDETENLNYLKKEETLLKNNINDSTDFQTELDYVSDSLSNIRSEIISIKNEISKQKSELDSVLQLRQNAVCPYCKQKLNEQHILEMEAKFLQSKDFLKYKLNTFEKDLETNQIKKNEFLNGKKQVETKKLELQKIQIQIARLNVVLNNKEQLKSKIIEKEKNKKLIEAKLQGSYFVEKITELDELDDKLNKIYSYKESYDSLSKIVNHYQKTNLDSIYVEHSNLIKSKQRKIEEKKIKEKSLLELDNEVFMLSKKLDEMKAIFQDRQEVENKLNNLDSEKESLENELMKMKENLAMRKTEHDNNLKQIESFNKKIAELEERVDKIIFTDQIGVWLNQHFIPSLEQIESQVLISVKEEFNRLFQKWFYLLIEVGDIDVEIDEFFTPIVNQSGYHLEVDSLSGGEKSSIALAYRLALNEIIRRMIMLEDNLLILDEPTDGFSKEQLVQIKYVLDELSAAQVIVVSHEKELEGFVETIFRVVKESEKSQVELAV
ncbi:MAG TPA: SMC family ATPase [Nitrososphaeraceae archaeon]|nr:SMC family ATPase [Nitrososphaeraceae archaeon]